MSEPIPSPAFRSGTVALAGSPNAGKSSLLNLLVGQKVAAAAPKAQTTRFQVKGIVDIPRRAQIVFIDTAGILEPGNALERGMRSQSEESAKGADQLLWLCSPELAQPLPPPQVLLKLGKARLILNKIDAFSKVKVDKLRQLLKETYPHLPLHEISVKKKRGVDELMEDVIADLPTGPPLFEEGEFTDQTLRQIAAEMIREKTLIFTRDEVPHGVAVAIDEYLEREDGIHEIGATIHVEREGQKGIVIGKGGLMLKKIGMSARKEMERAADTKVHLKLWVKVTPDWKKKTSFLKDLGYPYQRSKD